VLLALLVMRALLTNEGNSVKHSNHCGSSSKPQLNIPKMNQTSTPPAMPQRGHMYEVTCAWHEHERGCTQQADVAAPP
jgi:hypothetical protein